MLRSGMIRYPSLASATDNGRRDTCWRERRLQYNTSFVIVHLYGIKPLLAPSAKWGLAFDITSTGSYNHFIIEPSTTANRRSRRGSVAREGWPPAASCPQPESPKVAGESRRPTGRVILWPCEAAPGPPVIAVERCTAISGACRSKVVPRVRAPSLKDEGFFASGSGNA